MPTITETVKEYYKIIYSQVLIDVMKHNAIIDPDCDGSLLSGDTNSLNKLK